MIEREQFATPQALARNARARPDLFTHSAVDVVTEGLFALADPDEVLRKAGQTRAELRRLEADDEIATALETRLAAVLACTVQFQPYDRTIAPFVEAELAPHLECIIRGAWGAVPYGYAVTERVFIRRPDGRIGLAEEVEKPFEWFTPMRGGRLWYGGHGMGIGEVDTTVKFNLTTRNATWRNPYGESLLSRAYWPWFMRSAGWRFWSRFLERLGAPLLVGKTAGDTGAMADALLRAVQAGAVAVSTTDEVTTVDPHSQGEAFNLFSQRVDARIQKLILGQTLTSEVGAKGSYAAAKVHNEVRMDRREADLRLVRGALQRTVNALVALNFPGQPAPDVQFDTGRDLGTDRAERDSKLANSGIVKFTEQYLLDRYDFNRGDIEVPEAPPLPPALGAPAATPPGGDDEPEPREAQAALRAYFAAVAANGRDHEPDADLVDELAASLANFRN